MPNDSLTTLKGNLRALARTCPDLARRLAETEPAKDLDWRETHDGVPGAVLDARLLCSARRPREEAARLCDTVNLADAGVVLVLGFALGYHVEELAGRMGRNGVIVVFEPDLALLRVALERIDFSVAFDASNVVILDDPEDAAAMARATSGVEGIFALGIRVLEHPPSRSRLGARAQRFAEHFTGVVRSLRTNVVTTLMQVETTLRNQLMNLDHYATVPGVGDLAGIARGRPAIVVSAGPSLARNVHLLADPALRDRVVIIAAQTVLRPLLERGIRPHFVTALDYHEISRRFYEGLRVEDVEGVTLVAETKANPAILDAFPGRIRCPADTFLDRLLGPDLRRPMGEIPAGATVAHLACSLARHLACDPVILIGQDLGFTDGQYYAEGAAIHRVWASELNPFRTLEMLEWERIVRSRRTLRKLEDIHGRPIFTDEQMNAYLVQFERDFAAAEARGLRTIDASEGGVRKRHTEVRTLADSLAEYAREGRPPVSWPVPALISREERIARVRARIAQVRADVARVARKSRTTHAGLRRMDKLLRDPPRLNRLIEQVQAIGREVHALQPAFDLVRHLNQTGTLKRYKADRSINLDESLPESERQKRRIERDMMNVSWIADAADRLCAMLADADRALAGGAKLTRDVPAETVDPERSDPSVGKVEARPAARALAAVICVDPDQSPIAIERDLTEPLICGLNALRLTLERLARSRHLHLAILITSERAHVEGLVGGDIPGLAIEFMETDSPPLRARARALRGARRWAPECWRGGIANLSIFDEVCEPRLLAEAASGFGLDAALPVGADWALIDPGLTDGVIERHLEGPPARRFTFAHASPGLAPCLLAADLIRELSDASARTPAFSTIGALLGYVPVAPQHDPIASPACAGVDPRVRDLAFRCCADSSASRARIRLALAELGPEALDVTASDIAGRIGATLVEGDAAPRHLEMELVGARGERMEPDLCARLAEELRRARNDGAVTLTSAPGADALDHPALGEIVRGAVALGLPVHVRTGLDRDPSDAGALLEASPDVISVDLVAGSAEVYRRLSGRDGFHRVRENLGRLLEGRGGRGPGGFPLPWIVPRITRRDAVYEEIESLYDEWIMRAGWCVIDPLPEAREGERIRPLPPPEGARERFARTTLRVDARGRTPSLDRTLAQASLDEAWSGRRPVPA